jgi:ribonuclease P protein component
VLKKINRGLKRKDFEGIFADSRTFQTPLFGIKYQEAEQTQVGWIISKKISKRAVDRNKIKRRLAEAVGKIINNEELIINNYKIIFLVKKTILGATYLEIEAQVKYACEKIGIKTTNNL